MMKFAPKKITPCLLQVVVMPNGEVICLGRTVGWVKTLGKYLTPQETKEPATWDARHD